MTSRRSLLFIAAIIIIIVGILIAAILRPSVLLPSELEDREWVLVYYGDRNNPKAVLPNTAITAKFFDGRVGGSDGCNIYGADYTIIGEKLTIGPMVSTLKACEPEIMKQADEFTSALSSAQNFKVAGDTLEIGYDGGTLAFRSR